MSVLPDEASRARTVLEGFRYWKPEAQARALELIEERKSSPWHPFYCKNRGCNGHAHCIPSDAKAATCPKDPRGHPWSTDPDVWKLPGIWHCSECGITGTLVDEWGFEHARVDQHPPPWRGSWLWWLLSGGRGSGKTRSGAEVTHKATKITPRIILIAPTGPDLRETMVEGPSGILACSPPGKRPEWESSKKKLTWPNGCVALGFSAEEPDRLRGPQSGFIWTDEPAHYPDTGKVMDNALFGLRVKNDNGYDPKIVATSTPKPTSWVKERVAEADPNNINPDIAHGATVIHRVSTYANLRNLAPRFRETVLTKYEGTRTGKQELHGEVLDDIEGALWTWDMFRRVDHAPALTRVVVSIDPAGTTNRRSDLTGIIVLGVDSTGVIYVLADYSDKYSPAGWADRAIRAYDTWDADGIVAEKNYGGDMVRNTLQNSREGRSLAPHITEVHSRRGKDIRADPVVALYEKAKVWHVSDDPESGVLRTNLSELESEQTEWVPGSGSSPNRVDALVHGATHLGKRMMPASFATPTQLGASNEQPTMPGYAARTLGGNPFAYAGLGNGRRWA